MDNKILQEVSKCKNVEGVLKLAKDNNYEISKEKAEELFNKTHSNGELSDAELNGVAGGGCSGRSEYEYVPKPDCYEEVVFNSQGEVTFVVHSGDQIRCWIPHQEEYDTTATNGYIIQASVISANASYSVKNFKKTWHDLYTVSYTRANGKPGKRDVSRSNIIRG